MNVSETYFILQFPFLRIPVSLLSYYFTVSCISTEQRRTNSLSKYHLVFHSVGLMIGSWVPKTTKKDPLGYEIKWKSEMDRPKNEIQFSFLVFFNYIIIPYFIVHNLLCKLCLS